MIAMKMNTVTIVTILLLTDPILPHESTGGTICFPYTCTSTMCKPGRIAENPVATPTHSIQRGRDGERGPEWPKGRAGRKGDKGDPCQCDMADSADIQALRLEWEKMKLEYGRMTQKNLEMEKKLSELSKLVNSPESCEEYKANQQILGNDSPALDNVTIFPYKTSGNITGITVDCSISEVVIQRRQDGSVNFYREWADYVKGFGDRRGEFWIGLEELHRLTINRDYKLRIDMRNSHGESRYAEYSTFKVEDQVSKYRLTISGYSGDSGDSMDYHNGQKFTTKDSDNDADGGKNCAVNYTGAWWYKSCYHSNLNGDYAMENTKGIKWNHWSSRILRSVEMKIIPM